MKILDKKSSIDGEKEVVKSSTQKEMEQLKEEVMANKDGEKVMTNEDVKKYVEQVNNSMSDFVKEKEIPEEDLKKIDEVLSKLFRKIRQNPNDYIVKDEDGTYSLKEGVTEAFFKSLSPEDYAIMEKYEIE